MNKTINIAPTSRVEGHGKVSLQLNESGELIDARFHVMEFRGFEKFCQGRKVWEMPRITTRACGICPISHHLASAKACDDLFGVQIPLTAQLTRELLHMGQIVHSHALHFYYLAAPDFLFPGLEAKRNVLGVNEKSPDLVKQAIELRKMGQESNQIIGGKAIHPVTALPGGISKPLTHEEVQTLKGYFQRALDLSLSGLSLAKNIFDDNREFILNYANLNTNFLGLVKKGKMEMYDGNLRLINPHGETLEEFNPSSYLEHIGERTEDWSWLKFPFYKKQGWPDGIYRVGPLARINAADEISTPKANELLHEFREKYGRYPGHTLLFHYARLIETVYAAERALEILDDSNLITNNFRQKLKIQGGEGVGVIEAPRGTLIHHYEADDTGSITKANLIVSTIGNNPSMNQAVLEVAKDHIKGGEEELSEEVFNRIEMAIRAHDPCLSCATHAIGQMPLHCTVYNHEGKKVSEHVKD